LKSFLIFLALVIVGGAGYLLYLDYNKPTTSVQNQKPDVIAIVDTKENDVKRQSNDNPTWESIEVLSPLFSGDTLRTQKSSAHIKTNDGLIVQVRENTLLGLTKTPAGPDLDLKAGDIFSQTVTSNVIFSTRLATIKGDLADLHITTDVNGLSHVEVSKGKVTITDKNQKTVDLVQNGSADLNDGVLTTTGKASAIAVSTPTPLAVATPAPAPSPSRAHGTAPVSKSSASPIDLIKPDTGTVFNFEPENNSVDFSWSTNLNPKFYVLEVSNSSDFKKIIQSHTVNSPKDTIKDLKAQTYFWRVKAFGNKNEKLGVSKTNTFNLKVKMLTLPELVTPAAEITWSTPAPVEFSWKKMDAAAKYRIAIYKDLSQHSEVKFQITEAINFSWNWQTPRSYYWSVKGLNSKGNVISQSEVRHFTITGANKDKSPTYLIISPKDETEVIRDLTLEKPEVINFQWKVTKPLPGPLTLIISTDPEFTNPMMLKNVTKSIVPVTLKKEGVYYWNLSSQSEDGRDLELSPVITFNLKNLGALTAPKRIEPANESKIESEDPKAVTFTWKPSKNAVQYHFVLKKADPKTNEYFIMLEKTIKETTLISDPLENGSYSWNVYAKDAKEKEVGSEKDFLFGINAPFQMDSPKLKEPVIK
jgi:hypothetical protein